VPIIGTVLGNALLWLTVLAGSGALGWSLFGLPHVGDIGLAALVVVAAIVGELLKVTIYEARRQTLSFSLSVVVIMAAITIDPVLGPVAALMSSAAHVLVARQRSPIKIAFNLSNPVLSAGITAWVYQSLQPLLVSLPFDSIATAACAAVVYNLCNVGNMSLMISLHSGRSFRAIVRDSIWFTPTTVLLGLTGAFVGSIHGALGLTGAVMFSVPVLLMRFTLSFYARRSAATIAHLDYIARHDALTDLANRVELLERLQERLASGAEAVLLVLDLDRFKEINDTFGHHHGDMLLREIGPRLRTALADDDLIVRLGADEFAVLLASGTTERAAEVAQALLSVLQSSFTVAGYRISVSASVGTAVAPLDGSDAATLLRSADVAMHVAKRDQIGFALHAPEQEEYSPERLSLIGELREAIENGELLLHFQPQMELATEQIQGAEALVRWRHPERGLIPPDTFIPLAEHAGLIRPLTRWVLDAALRQCREWLDDGWALRVSINASVQDLRDTTFADHIRHALELHGVAAEYLCVEITESAMMSDPTAARGVLERVRALGVSVAIDDFGTGYSSLAYLKRLPTDELKLDRSFVRHIATDDGDRAIVRASIALAHDLGLSVVAEGAEDTEGLAALGRVGCDLVQGYVLSKPLPAEQFATWMSGRLANAREHAPDERWAA
jgi:diguanylate cyclase (GGDEF)-like protein